MIAQDSICRHMFYKRHRSAARRFDVTRRRVLSFVDQARKAAPNGKGGETPVPNVTTMTEKPAPRALIRMRRKAAGLTQAELGERVDIGMRQVVRWELGESFPSEEIAARLVDVLGGDANDYVRPSDFDDVPDAQREVERLRRRNRELERRLEAVEAAMATLVDQVEERRRA